MEKKEKKENKKIGFAECPRSGTRQRCGFAKCPDPTLGKLETL